MNFLGSVEMMGEKVYYIQAIHINPSIIATKPAETMIVAPLLAVPKIF